MNLVGRWRKVSSDRCAEAYPDELELRPDGTYGGTKDPSSPLQSLWDVGTYELLEPHQVRLSTANDAEIVYRVAASGDTLTLIDPGGCRFEYRRQSS